jgi:putative transposase
MVAIIKDRYGQANRVPEPIERLTNNRLLHRTRHLQLRSQHRIGAAYDTDPQHTIDGMVETFIRTLKRDYVQVNSRPDA